MSKIVRLTESDLINIVKKVLSEQISTTDAKYKIYPEGGWVKDSRNNTMCVKVESGFPFGTFAQGITKMWKKSDGSAVIVPNGSKIGNIELEPYEVKSALTSLISGRDFVTTKNGAKIIIGKSVVGFCKKDWTS